MGKNVKLRKKGPPDQKIADKTASPNKRRKSSHFSFPGVMGAIITALIALTWPATPKLNLFSTTSHHPNPLAPSRFPKLSSLPQFSSSSNHTSSLLWGTYRPGSYFGLRTRLPQSLIAGLMWADLDPSSPQHWNQLRHEALQSNEGLSTYGWTRHDGKGFGEQNILDRRLNITAIWSKSREYYTDWGAFIDMRRKGGGGRGADEFPDDDAKAMLLFYFANEDGSSIDLKSTKDLFSLKGESIGIGKWQAAIQASSSSSLKDNTSIQVNYLGLQTPHLHNLTDTVKYMLGYSIWQQRKQGIIDVEELMPVLPNQMMPHSNVVIIQVTAAPATLTLQVAFTSTSSGSSSSSSKEDELKSRLLAVSGPQLSQLVEEKRYQFDQQFALSFPSSSSKPTTQAHRDLAKKALSNMLGGIGYWYGHSLAKSPSSSSSSPVSTSTPLWNTPLYSAVPSRSFFPRGFLWDEGFHQLLIRKYDPAISRDIIAHWLDLQTESGWIPREVILGEEAKSRVPSEFIVQSPDAANPPTLFLVLSEMAQNALQFNDHKSSINDKKAKAKGECGRKDKEFLIAAWPRLKAWHGWYVSTQSGNVDGAFRWRGRDGGGNADKELNPKTLTSGLDDFPRASHPTEEERHVDLRCWMALATRAMVNIGKMVLMDSIEKVKREEMGGGKTASIAAAAAATVVKEEVETYEELAAKYEDFEILNKLHYDSNSGQYRDWGLHTEAVSLVKKTVADSNNNGRTTTITVRQVDQPPSWQYIPHYGYISLFPLLMKLIPKNDPILRQQLELMRNEELLWTPGHGLRSLAKNSSMYMKYNTQHDPPYWRGPVWINMNYLAVSALRYYEGEGGEYGEMAGQLGRELRAGLVEMCVEEYERTGYLWENYGDEDGRGKGSHPFTGWTALMALL
jgi:mannosyl-oligosaccharide glucosidase